jgi:hypothetical protein
MKCLCPVYIFRGSLFLTATDWGRAWSVFAMTITLEAAFAKLQKAFWVGTQLK